jgi:hypothetical protein
MRKVLKREQILVKRKLPTEWVPAPEWAPADGAAAEFGVYVRALSGKERDHFEAVVQGLARVKPGGKPQPNVENYRARLCALAICDEEGAALFTPDDVEELGQQSSAALDRVLEVANRLSGITRRDMEELEKDFQNGQASA